MKITFVTPFPDMSGGIKVISIHAQLLARRGHDVSIVSQGFKKPDLKTLVRSVLKDRDFTYFKSKPSHLDYIRLPHKIINHPPPITDKDVPDADIVVATWWETAEWVMNLSDFKGAKVYFIQAHEIYDYLPKERVSATYAFPMQKITISRWLVDIMRNKYGDAETSLVPNSVDTNQFHAPPRDHQPVPTVGMLYSKVYWKGCDISLKAFELATEEIPDLRLVAFGKEAFKNQFPRGTRYYQLPPQDKIRDIYAGCDVWLCGSWEEGFGLTVLEAMACRCPAVSTKVGGPLDIIEDGVNGFLVPTGDIKGLSGKLIKVLSMPDERWKQMSEAAYRKAASYKWEDASLAFEKALQKAIKRRRQGKLG